MSSQPRGVRRQPAPARKREATNEPTILRPDMEPTPVDLESQANSFADVTASTLSTKLGYWVECPLPAYDGMKVLFRTSNRTRVRMERPTYEEPYELRRKRRQIAELRSEQVQDFTEERDLQIDNLKGEIISDANAYEDSVQLAQTEWLSKFVLDFDPWPFKHLTMPDPKNPKSYHILYTDLEDLYSWIVNYGYVKALEYSVKNFSRD